MKAILWSKYVSVGAGVTLATPLPMEFSGRALSLSNPRDPTQLSTQKANQFQRPHEAFNIHFCKFRRRRRRCARHRRRDAPAVFRTHFCLFSFGRFTHDPGLRINQIDSQIGSIAGPPRSRDGLVVGSAVRLTAHMNL
ncbi:hypothetical protein Zmor_013511 [Zophobas morio]|uniref:Uncharacterized protein n=1 Tax=Zophobas morio TaxID=2755281 RepID=A0AA38IFM3_9CUCU|nr:hypothetical protein Zmor_013511 [Zophobas morio]